MSEDLEVPRAVATAVVCVLEAPPAACLRLYISVLERLMVGARERRLPLANGLGGRRLEDITAQAVSFTTVPMASFLLTASGCSVTDTQSLRLRQQQPNSSG